MQLQIVGSTRVSVVARSSNRHVVARSSALRHGSRLSTHPNMPSTRVLPSLGITSVRSRQVQCQGLFGLGLPEIAVIAGVAALIFGPSKLPEIGRGLGKTVKSFQSAAKEFETELKAAASEDEPKSPESSTAKDADKEKVGKS